MARKRRSSRKSSKCPEPFNTLIDIGAMLLYGYLSDKWGKKRGRRSGKIDPYEATGWAMGMGYLNDTEDLIKFGGMLGAMGAFDPEDELYIDTDAYTRPRNNRYAWRLNCEDGRKYGICPENYETRDAYNRALSQEKEKRGETERAQIYRQMVPISVPQHREDPEEPVQKGTEPDCDPYREDDFHVYLYCLVELSCSHQQQYFRTEDRTLKKGDRVVVMHDGAEAKGTIQNVEHHMRFSVPTPVEETPEVLRKD